MYSQDQSLVNSDIQTWFTLMVRLSGRGLKSWREQSEEVDWYRIITAAREKISVCRFMKEKLCIQAICHLTVHTKRLYVYKIKTTTVSSNMFSASPTGFFGHVDGILAHGRKNVFSVGVIGVAIFFFSLFLRFLAVVLKRIQLSRLK